MRKHFFNDAEKGYFKEERSAPNPMAMGGTTASILLYMYRVYFREARGCFHPTPITPLRLPPLEQNPEI